MKISNHVAGICLAGSAMLICGCAQMQEVADRVKGMAGGSSASTADPKKSPAVPDGTEPVKLKTREQIALELLPDRTCQRPLEKFDIAAKVIEYGGTVAQLRLKRFADSDFKFSDLTPKDKELLDFLAATTIWIPLKVENYVIRAYETVAKKKPELKPMQRTAKEEAETRLKLFREQVEQFPGDVRFDVDSELSDGVYAQLGASVTTSPTFLGLMAENQQARDLLLAHELSHVYKRHRLKKLQARLVATPVGFELAKKLLEIAESQSARNPMDAAIFLVTSGPALIEFIRNTDLSYTKEQELEADACAAVWLQRAGVDRCAAWRGFKAIAPTDGEYATTHPTTKEREENYFKKIDGSGCGVVKKR